MKREHCGTCEWYMDDGLCHRYPPTVVEQDVSFNLVSHGPYMTIDGGRKPVTNFPMVKDWWVCGEHSQRDADEPEHAMDGDEFFALCMTEEHEKRLNGVIA